VTGKCSIGPTIGRTLYNWPISAVYCLTLELYTKHVMLNVFLKTVVVSNAIFSLRSLF
jgi:hypothetical protein